MIEAFLDYRSPYSYLALNGLQQLGERFEITLIDVGWVMAEAKNQPSPNCPPKLKYARMDSRRSAMNEGVPFAPNQLSLGAVGSGALPAQFLMRAGIAAKKLGFDMQFNTAVFRCLWAGVGDLTTPEARENLLTASGIDAPMLWRDATTDWTQKVLEEHNQRAVHKGVFGVPTIFVDDEMFFGNDRLPLIRKKLSTGRAAA